MFILHIGRAELTVELTLDIAMPVTFLLQLPNDIVGTIRAMCTNKLYTFKLFTASVPKYTVSSSAIHFQLHVVWSEISLFIPRLALCLCHKEFWLTAIVTTIFTLKLIHITHGISRIESLANKAAWRAHRIHVIVDLNRTHINTVIIL